MSSAKSGCRDGTHGRHLVETLGDFLDSDVGKDREDEQTTDMTATLDAGRYRSRR